MDIMIDTEFLSFRMDSYILSIGAVAFNVEDEEFKAYSEFYEVPTIESQVHGKMDDGVFNFWMAAEPEAKKAIVQHKEKKGNSCRDHDRSWKIALRIFDLSGVASRHF